MVWSRDGWRRVIKGEVVGLVMVVGGSGVSFVSLPVSSPSRLVVLVVGGDERMLGLDPAAARAIE